MSQVTVTKQGRIAVATVNNPPVNALSHGVRQGLADAIDQLAADANVAAMVIIADGRTFMAGADIREFGKPLVDPQLQNVVLVLERSTKPVIAAIHGTALGGGLEVALACHYRVAVASAKVGLPEVKLGILPGAGGTQRLPRLVGAETALKLITEGSEVKAPDAKAMGIIDEIVEGDLLAGAVRFAEKVVADGSKIRRTGDITPKLDNPGIFEEFAKQVAKKQRGFEAPVKCVEAVKLAFDFPIEEGSKREYALCRELMASDQSKAQRHAFFAEREVAKVPGLPDDTPTRDVKSMAVIGSGAMGTGISMCFASIGIPVVLLGRNQADLDKGVANISKLYAGSVKRGSLKQEDMDTRMGLIRPTLSYDDIAQADLVIEAVYEEMPVKKEVFAKLGKATKPGCILASNTSYLNIDELAQASGRPADVCGMHFFNPANVMRLLENVRGKATAPDVLATIMKVGKQIGKLPVLVGVSDGFVGNRMLAKRSRECHFMLEEGATPWQIDKALVAFGFPMGPYAVADLAGLDVGWANRKSRFDRLSKREQDCNIIDKICEQGKFGQKTGSGYYKYDENRVATPDPEIEALIVAHSAERGITRRTISDQEIVERCVYSMINEGARILEEGVAPRAHEIDIVWLHGFGFPRYRGGPMFHADLVGVRNVHTALERYADQVGKEYYEPAPLLAKLAAEGKGFYTK
jgi:3-hydroxyacyl-CoA dehydrogenase